ncbi:MAG TPA: hypothetical protein VH256_10070, partial [Thermoleophilaceae bacterium]|nr:hypothetical protein [Thermoleophilaceae bacterium]
RLGPQLVKRAEDCATAVDLAPVDDQTGHGRPVEPAHPHADPVQNGQLVDPPIRDRLALEPEWAASTAFDAGIAYSLANTPGA